MIDANPFIHTTLKVPHVVISLYANPLTEGHIDYIQGATKLGLVTAIVNNDRQVALKGSCPFMTEKARLKIVGAVRGVSRAVLSVDDGPSVEKTLSLIHSIIPVDIFANGGPEYSEKDCREYELCLALGIKLACGVGGTTKVSSSSELVRRAVAWWGSR